MPAAVLCANCEESGLELIDDDDIVGYVCAAASDEEKRDNRGCGQLITPTEYKSRCKQPQSHQTTTLKPQLSSAAETANATAALSLAAKLAMRKRQFASSFSADNVNACALRGNGVLRLQRAAVIPLLSVRGHENPNAQRYLADFAQPRRDSAPKKAAEQLFAVERTGRRLGVRGWSRVGMSASSIPTTFLPAPADIRADVEQIKAAALTQCDGVEPLIVWRCSDDMRSADTTKTYCDVIQVPSALCKFLRPHQREGVLFLCECVLGLRAFKGNGAILADDMGLGKTLQSIAVLYTLLVGGFQVGQTVVRRALIITPTSLVQNWRNEITKWTNDKIEAESISESSRDDVQSAITAFLLPRSKTQCLILSYDTYRLHHQLFLSSSTTIDLMICDEAHRLKNNRTSTYTSLDSLPCSRRILLSGTPLQNNLEELYSMINMTNRNVLGDRLWFKRHYEQPILGGREPEALEEEKQIGTERSIELSAIINQFVLRRTNVLLSKHLPPKVMQIVCCRPSALQLALYKHFLKSKDVKRVMSDGNSSRPQILPLIGALKKLCNHPKLIYDAIHGTTPHADDEDGADSKLSKTGFSGCDKYFNAAYKASPADAAYSGKMYVLVQLLTILKSKTDDRVVIVSNFTSALDVMADICKSKQWQYVRLDGSTSIKNRQKLVDQLSDRSPANKLFVFLLSSRAGGCGLNLIGANRLILFDPDWNPAVDKQAAARVWRDGQSKRCYIYRFLTTGTIEEKIFQRQLSKEGLAGVLGGSAGDAALSEEELRDLFKLRDKESGNATMSDTHDSLECNCLENILITKEENEAKMAADKSVAKASTSAEPDDTNALLDENNDAEAEAMTIVQECANDEMSDGNDDDDDLDAFVVNDEEDDDDSDDGDAVVVERRAKRTKKTSRAEVKAAKSARSTARKSAALSRQLRFQPLVIDHIKLNALKAALIGQRGAPCEEELINWAHHVTPASLPDPLMRQACAAMKRTAEGWSYVSFAFSCEVAGKLIGANVSGSVDVEESAESRMFAAFSAKCALPPVVKVKPTNESAKLSADEALTKHLAAMAEHEKKKRKRLGIRDEEINGARRHSSRNAGKQRLSLEENAMAAAADGSVSRAETIDPTVLNSCDEATLAAIQAALVGTEPRHKRPRKSRVIADESPPPTPNEPQRTHTDEWADEENVQTKAKDPVVDMTADVEVVDMKSFPSKSNFHQSVTLNEPRTVQRLPLKQILSAPRTSPPSKAPTKAASKSDAIHTNGMNTAAMSGGTLSRLKKTASSFVDEWAEEDGGDGGSPSAIVID